MVGTSLKGKWKIEAKIASGGVATVYVATHRNGSRVAIKILDDDFSENEDMRRRFLREGYAANAVGHAAVVRVLDDDVTESGNAFLVMELLEGESLEARRTSRGGTLPLEEVMRLSDELLDVLAAAHEKGIIHRDIKPSNLFMTKDGHLKVLDFGLAKVKLEMQGEATAASTLLGTPGFMPPERVRGDAIPDDARVDVWSVGATIFNLLSGAYVFDGTSTLDLLRATTEHAPRSLADSAPEVPAAIASVVDRALAASR
jgi:eukaryotic-like serine/threonine-protein kinase